MADLGKLSLPEGVPSTPPVLQSFLELSDAFLLDPEAPIKLIHALNELIGENSVVTGLPAGLGLRGNLLVGPNVTLLSGTVIEGPCVIGEGTVVGPNAFLRPGTIIGASVRVGFGVEVKLSVLFDKCSVSHYSYVGNSLIGENANIGAATIFANRRLDDACVSLATPSSRIATQLSKLGSVVERDVKIGVSVALMPGTWIGRGVRVMPKQCVSGYVAPAAKSSAQPC